MRFYTNSKTIPKVITVASVRDCVRDPEQKGSQFSRYTYVVSQRL